MADLRRAMGCSSQTLSNWKARGVSTEGALQAELLFGVPASSLMTHKPRSGKNAPQPTSTNLTLVRDNLGSYPHPYRVVTGPQLDLVPWDRMVTDESLPTSFRIELHDLALAPDLMPGDELHIDRSLEPAPGDIALLRSADGHCLARVLQQQLPGRWIAVGMNDAFAPLDVQALGLTVVGIACCETRRRRRSAA
jgi:hypothetical protein